MFKSVDHLVSEAEAGNVTDESREPLEVVKIDAEAVEIDGESYDLEEINDLTEFDGAGYRLLLEV